MKLIIGLGNIGKKYQKNRHNIGFLTIDKLAKKLGASFSINSKLMCEIAKAKLNDQQILLAKPTTMMNLSGQAVAKLASYYKISTKDIWIISDDFHLSYGVIRTRIGGSSGGHNGLKSIIENIGENFVRIRMGVKNPQFDLTNSADFVLKNFSVAELKALDSFIDTSAELIISLLEDKLIQTTIAK